MSSALPGKVRQHRNRAVEISKKGVEIMTERDLRRYEIMDQYGVDEDTAELMLIDEEEEEECEHQNKGII